MFLIESKRSLPTELSLVLAHALFAVTPQTAPIVL
jgi:hypothetical protein